MSVKPIYINVALALFSTVMLVLVRQQFESNQNTRPRLTSPIATSIPIKRTTYATPLPTALEDTSEIDACGFKEGLSWREDAVEAESVDKLPFLSATYIDLSNNNLQVVPVEKIDTIRVEQLSLVQNNISDSEQQKIRALLPNTEISFFPQEYDSAKITADWKTFTNIRGRSDARQVCY